mmetsp:Transcript_8783/g.15812  ORF Transcript_8783/g.15812 Transcript_8783/m.15812 type:complete len:242 (-) Transcript_8783:236-961(-)
MDQDVVQERLTDSLKVIQFAVLTSHGEELEAVEAWLRDQLDKVSTRLGRDPPNVSKGAEEAMEVGTPGGKELSMSGSVDGDALEEWYTDPWAKSASSTRRRGNSDSPPRRGTSDRTPSDNFAIKELVETFSLAEFDDGDLEAEDATGAGSSCQGGEAKEEGADISMDERWQYGRCAALKLVSLSPPGCSTFEALLVVLMKIFNISQKKQDEAQALRAQLDASNSSWWPRSAARCLAPRPQV